MSAQAQHGPAAIPTCWCCGRLYHEASLTRLGQHPEVGVCLGCAVFLKRRATAQRDTGNRSPAAWARGAVDTVREAVISRGWHEHGPLAALLRRIDRQAEPTPATGLLSGSQPRGFTAVNPDRADRTDLVRGSQRADPAPTVTPVG